MIRTIKAVALLGTLALAGCETTGGGTDVVCQALIGPIKYTSTNRSSARFAGSALAPDLAVRNRVGTNLRCKEYV